MTSTPAVPHPGMGFMQFVALVAALMAVNALVIDSMLPAGSTVPLTLGFALLGLGVC